MTVIRPFASTTPTPTCTTTTSARWTQPSDVACGTTKTAVCNTGRDSCGNTLQCTGTAPSVTGTKCAGSDQYCDGSSCITCASDGGEWVYAHTFYTTDTYSGEITEYGMPEIGTCSGGWSLDPLLYEYDYTNRLVPSAHYCSSPSESCSLYDSAGYFSCPTSGTTCTLSDSFYDGYAVGWRCKCGASEKAHSFPPYSSACLNSGNGCATPSWAWTGGGDDFAWSLRDCTELGPRAGPSGDWTCKGNYQVYYGNEFQSTTTSCSAASYPAGATCCHSGYGCDGDYLQYYSGCSADTTDRTFCDYGCWEAPTDSSRSSLCYPCNDNGGCGSDETCVTGSTGRRYCEQDDGEQ